MAGRRCREYMEERGREESPQTLSEGEVKWRRPLPPQSLNTLGRATAMGSSGPDNVDNGEEWRWNGRGGEGLEI